MEWKNRKWNQIRPIDTLEFKSYLKNMNSFNFNQLCSIKICDHAKFYNIVFTIDWTRIANRTPYIDSVAEWWMTSKSGTQD